jgi:hypothetical protein
MTLAFATTVMPAATGCMTRQCTGSTLTWTTGDWIDQDTWETNDVNGPWIPYDGNETLTIKWTNPDGGPARTVFDVTPYIGVVGSGASNPNQDNDDGGTNFTWGAGQVVENLHWTEDSVVVLNNSCAPYLARFIIFFRPLPVDAGTPPKL